TGTLLLITHDRYLMKSIGCPILYLEDGKASFYENFAALAARVASPVPKPNDERAVEEKKPSVNAKEERRLKAEVRAKSKELETEIEKLGADITGMENEMTLPEVTCDHVRLTELCDALGDARFAQKEKYDAWEKLLEEYGEYLI
ncbi:MAG: ABC transporter ATP-binding protein, partial [Pygmaiobacter sp.]